MLFPRVVGAQTWQPPPVEDIFEEGIEQEISQQEIRQRVKIIEETLASFGVEARVREINLGPAVTQFGVEPGYLERKDSEGRQRKVRVARIVNLDQRPGPGAGGFAHPHRSAGARPAFRRHRSAQRHQVPGRRCAA